MPYTYAYDTDRSFHASSRPNTNNAGANLTNRFFSYGPDTAGPGGGWITNDTQQPGDDDRGRGGGGQDQEIEQFSSAGGAYESTYTGRGGIRTTNQGTLARTSAFVHKGFYDLLSILPNSMAARSGPSLLPSLANDYDGFPTPGTGTVMGMGTGMTEFGGMGGLVRDEDRSDGIAKDWDDQPLMGKRYEDTVSGGGKRGNGANSKVTTPAGVRKAVPPVTSGTAMETDQKPSLPSPSPRNAPPRTKPQIQTQPQPHTPQSILRKPPPSLVPRPNSNNDPRNLNSGYPNVETRARWQVQDQKPLRRPVGMEGGIDKRLISWPLEFRHVAHASDHEEAQYLLIRWAVEGQGKVADPLWAKGIREQVKLRAADQQARAIAQVMVAREQGLIQNQPYQTLRVVNGMPSSIYSSTIQSIRNPSSNKPGPPRTPTGAPKSSPRLPSSLNPSTPTRISNHNPFEATFKPVIGETSVQAVNALADGRRADGDDVMLERPISPPTQPLRLKSKKGVPPSKEMAPQVMRVPQVVSPQDIDGRGFTSTGMTLDRVPSQETIREFSDRKKRSFPPEEEDVDIPPTTAARDVTPSLPTLEKAASTAIFFETLYHALLKAPKTLGAVHANNYMLARERRRLALEEEMDLQGLLEYQKLDLRQRWLEEETQALREKRTRVGTHSFVSIKTIGHGAFGVVSLVKEKETGNLYAMKRLRKNDMLRKGQEGHIRAEKDLLAAAASIGNTMSSWIVKLHYSFQDVDHLYLVLAYEGGGDLLNLLIERDTFDEGFTKFYMAELVLALEATHSLGYIHRDIKPDNLLLSNEGHLRISDFGLAHDTHWSHDTAYYEQQRRALLKRHGIDLEEPSGKQLKTMKRREVEQIMGKEWLAEGQGMLTWRDKKRRALAFSVCGTNSYMSPEVIRGVGYGFSCDWWSLGVIAFECLYGYPPFVSNSRHVTRQKILNWRQSLRFPTKPRLTSDCTDFLSKLLCEPEDRLGTISTASVSRPNSLVLDARMSGSQKMNGSIKPSMSSKFGLQAGDGAVQLKSHPWFKGIDWEHLHLRQPPYQPNLRHPADTQHFDDNIPDQPLAAPDGAPAHATKDPMLADKKHGSELLELRKGLAFAGWTYKANKISGHRLVALRGDPSDADAIEDGGDTEFEQTPTPSARQRAMSF